MPPKKDKDDLNAPMNALNLKDPSSDDEAGAPDPRSDDEAGAPAPALVPNSGEKKKRTYKCKLCHKEGHSKLSCPLVREQIHRWIARSSQQSTQLLEAQQEIATLRVENAHLQNELNRLASILSSFTQLNPDDFNFSDEDSTREQ